MGLFSAANLFGMTIRESANDGSDFTNPDADYRRLFLGEDGQLHVKDSAGAVTDIGGAVTEITDIPTADTTTTNVLAPDGAGGVEWRAEAGGSLTSDEATRTGSDVTLTNANQWYDVVSLTLAAGTWLVLANCQFLSTGGTNHQYQARIYDGSTTYVEGQQFDPVGNWKDVSLATLVDLGGSTTVKLQACDTTATNGVVSRDLSANGSSKATRMTAVQIA